MTPLGCGVETTWKHLIDGKCGIRALCLEDLKMNAFNQETQLSTFDQLASKVAGIVPTGTNLGEFNEEMWLNPKVCGWLELGSFFFLLNVYRIYLLVAWFLFDNDIYGF